MSTEPSVPHRHSVARTAAAVLAAAALLATTGSAFGWAAVNRLQGNITVDSSLGDLLGDGNPDSPDATEPTDPTTGYQAENILLIGSDTRTGQGSGYGNAATTSSGNGQSDTAILLHISADRKNAFGISIPRDSWVTRPSCNADGSTDGTLVTGKFNAAYSAGGRKCVVRAVKYLTGVKIDHFVEVDFKGFKRIVDALGGVQICTTKALRDPVYQDSAGNWHGSGLELKKGQQTISGDQAVAFVRARNLDGTADIGRMDRQQAFISSIIRSATDSGLLTDLPRLYGVLDAVTSSLTVDAGLSGDALKDFVLSLQGVSPSEITFRTVPWTPRGDNSNVLWNTTAAAPIWQAMKDDTPWPVRSSRPAGQKPLTAAPQDVRVQVLNGSGTTGLGAKAARQLQRQGFVIAGVATAPGALQSTTSIAYDPAYDESARTLAYAASTTVPAATPGLGRTLTLTVGADWTKAKRVTIVAPGSTVGRTADDASCIS